MEEIKLTLARNSKKNNNRTLFFPTILLCFIFYCFVVYMLYDCRECTAEANSLEDDLCG